MAQSSSWGNMMHMCIGTHRSSSDPHTWENNVSLHIPVHSLLDKQLTGRRNDAQIRTLNMQAPLCGHTWSLYSWWQMGGLGMWIPRVCLLSTCSMWRDLRQRENGQRAPVGMAEGTTHKHQNQETNRQCWKTRFSDLKKCEDIMQREVC